MPTDTIKWIEINWNVLDTINDNKSTIEYKNKNTNWIKILLKQFDPINF